MGIAFVSIALLTFWSGLTTMITATKPMIIFLGRQTTKITVTYIFQDSPHVWSTYKSS